MIEPIKQLIDSAGSVRMTDAERSGVRRTLEAYTTVYSPSVSVWAFLGRHAFASALMVVLLIAGGTTAVAHRAAPDDALYSVRLAVEDQIGTLLTNDDDEQIATELTHMERMLDDEEFALDDELLAVSGGIEDESSTVDSDDGEIDDVDESGSDDIDSAEEAGNDDETDEDDIDTEDRGDRHLPLRSRTPAPPPVRYDDGADIELDSIMQDLESAAQETPDMGE